MAHDTKTILTALAGAAGAIAAGPQAQATTVLTSYLPGAQPFVGFSGGVASAGFSFTVGGSTVLTIDAFRFNVHSHSGAAFPVAVVGVSAPFTLSYFGVKTVALNVANNAGSLFDVVTAAPAGASWGNDPAATSATLNANFMAAESSTQQFPVPGGSNYYLFAFNAGAGIEYGWVQASLSAADGADFGVTIQAIAYNNDGSPISVPSVPEPGSAGLLALGALVSGAAGTRRFKRARARA